jgi:PIN domain nuclease of toxin-antitoxin system
MSVVLDAYAVIAALVGERACAEVRPLLAGGVLCAPNLAEVIDVCVRVYGNADADVRERVGWLISGGLEVAAFDTGLALGAGSLRARHYRRRTCEVSLGDCCALALAKRRSLALATADPELASAARAESLDLLALPDSSGRRPR